MGSVRITQAAADAHYADLLAATGATPRDDARRTARRDSRRATRQARTRLYGWRFRVARA
ncbi:MAG TPA: hypothetical protein VK204_00910 [Nocardioidaceae bacterium]|jgi:hypothetical protein|nr:hypothetical protein [Nocardioidaceae bacterium]